MSRPENRPNPDGAPPDPAGKRFYLGLGGITFLALAWRVFYVIHERGRILLNGDAFYYHWQSILISQGKGFIDPGQYMLFGRVTPSAGHPPAYILYLAAVAKFVGTSELTQRLASTLLGAGADCGTHGARHRTGRAEPGRGHQPVPVPRGSLRVPRDP